MTVGTVEYRLVTDIFEDLTEDTSAEGPSEDARFVVEAIERIFFLLVKQMARNGSRGPLRDIVDHIKKRTTDLYSSDFWSQHFRGFDIKEAIAKIAERVLERMEKTYGVHEGPRPESRETGEEV